MQDIKVKNIILGMKIKIVFRLLKNTPICYGGKYSFDI